MLCHRCRAAAFLLFSCITSLGVFDTSARAQNAPIAGERPVSFSTEPAPPSHESPEYQAIIAEAVSEFSAQNWLEARTLFARAHALSPSARTQRGIGMAEFALRNYPASVAQLEAALASPVRPLDGSLKTDTEELLARARRFVGRLQIEVEPTSAELRLDRVVLNPAPSGPITVSVGDHVVEASVPGHAPEERRLSVQGGETTTVTILFARPVAASVAAPTGADHPAPKRWYKSPWLWGAVGAVVAGGVTAAVIATRRGAEVEAPFQGNVPAAKAP